MGDRLAQLKALLETDPRDTFCLYSLAQEHAKLGDDAKAIEYYDLTIRQDQDYFYAYFHKARSLERLEREDEARDTLRQGLARAQAAGDAKAVNELSAFLEGLS